MVGNRWKALFGAVVLASTISTAQAAVADGGDCTGTQTGGTIDGSVHVSSGQKCFLVGVHVTGNLVADPGSFVQTRQGTAIDGSIGRGSIGPDPAVHGPRQHLNPQSDRFPFDTPSGRVLSFPAQLCGSTVGGSVVITDAPGQAASGGDGIAVGGGGSCAANGGGNSIGAHLVFQRNISLTGPTSQHLTISNNVVGGLMYCTDNTPPPHGSNNTAAGKLGQCASL